MLYEGNFNNTLSNNTERISAIANYKISLLNKRLNLVLGSIFNSDRFIGKSFLLIVIWITEFYPEQNFCQL